MGDNIGFHQYLTLGSFEYTQALSVPVKSPQPGPVRLCYEIEFCFEKKTLAFTPKKLRRDINQCFRYLQCGRRYIARYRLGTRNKRQM